MIHPRTQVDRRRVDYYETARKLQGLGVEAPTSPSSTPIQSSSAADPSEEGKTSSDSERTEAHESVPTTAGDVNFQSRVGGGSGGDGEGERPKDGDAGGSGGSSKWTDGGEGFYTGAAADQMATVALAAAASARAQAAATGARYDTPPGWIGMATGADATAEAAAEEVVTASEEAAAASEETATASEEAAAAGEGTAVAGEAPVDALHARAAPSSEAIAEDDLRIVATALVKRLGSGKPLKPDIFEEFSAAVDRMLADTAAA